MPQELRKHAGFKFLAVFLALQTVSCGTLLYPERRGQPAGRLDAGVVALDAVGLLLFLIPGIIAFAVDFADGTIYLPPDGYSFSIPPDRRHWQTIQVDAAQLNGQRLEAILSERTGQAVTLEPGTYRAARISHIQDVTPLAINQLQAEPVGAKVVFRGTSE